MTKTISIPILVLVVSCAPQVETENKRSQTTTKTTSEAMGKTTNTQDDTDIMTSDTASKSDSTDSDTSKIVEEVPTTPTVDEDKESPAETEKLGSITDASGSLVEKDFNPVSTYAQILDGPNGKSFSIAVSEFPYDDNSFRKVKEYKCMSCEENDFDCSQDQPEYQTMTITLADAQVFNNTTFQFDQVDAVDDAGFPVADKYQKASTTDTSLTVTLSPDNLTGGNLPDIDALTFDEVPAADDDLYKVTLEAKFVEFTQTEFSGSTQDYKVTLEGKIISIPNNPTPPTCDSDEYLWPIYE